MSGARRPERLAEQIREEVTLIIAGELEDPRVASVTVTEVRLSPDRRHAKIYVSVSGNDQEVKGSLAALKHASGFIRYQLGSVLRMKRTPELHFVYDETDENAARIEQLLSEEVKKANERLDQESADSASPAGGVTV
jgi:ribosome-binding factor A